MSARTGAAAPERRLRVRWPGICVSTVVERYCAGDVAEAACNNYLLNALPQDELSLILAGAVLTRLEHRRVLYREDGRMPAIYFPTTAVISILMGAAAISLVEIATVGNEGVVGASAVLGVQRAFGRTVVQVGGEAIAVPARDAPRLLCDQPGVSTIMRRYLYAFVREVGQSGACNRLHTSEERCARWLLMTQDRAASDRFSMTQEFLAAMMGSRRPTVNLTLSVLRKAGAIDYSYRIIQVLDRERLESFACPCYSLIHKAFEVVRL